MHLPQNSTIGVDLRPYRKQILLGHGPLESRPRLPGGLAARRAGAFGVPWARIAWQAGAVVKPSEWEVAVAVKTVMGSHFGVGDFTTQFRTHFSGWIGMFTGGTIWIWTHGQRGSKRSTTSGSFGHAREVGGAKNMRFQDMGRRRVLFLDDG